MLFYAYYLFNLECIECIVYNMLCYDMDSCKRRYGLAMPSVKSSLIND